MNEWRSPTVPRGPGRSEAKERLWRQHVERQRQGKLTIRGYCARYGIPEPNFYAWRRELARRDSESGRSAPGKSKAVRPVRPAEHATPRFLPVTIAGSPLVGAVAQHVEVVLPGGLLIRVPAHDTAALQTVLEHLEPRRC